MGGAGICSPYASSWRDHFDVKFVLVFLKLLLVLLADGIVTAQDGSGARGRPSSCG